VSLFEETFGAFPVALFGRQSYVVQQTRVEFPQAAAGKITPPPPTHGFFQGFVIEPAAADASSTIEKSEQVFHGPRLRPTLDMMLR
jgi:hypothetical protein